MGITAKQAQAIAKTVTVKNAKSTIQRFCCPFTTDFPPLEEMVSVDSRIAAEGKEGTEKSELYAYKRTDLDLYLLKKDECFRTRGKLRKDTLQPCKNLFGLVLAIVDAAGHLQACIAADEEFRVYAKTPNFTTALLEGKDCLAKLLQIEKAADLRFRMEKLNVSQPCTDGQIRLLEGVLGFQVGACSLENCPDDLLSAGAEVKERADDSEAYEFCLVSALPAQATLLEPRKIYFAKEAITMEGDVLNYCVLNSNGRLAKGKITIPEWASPQTIAALLDVYKLKILTQISENGHIYSEKMAAIFNVPAMVAANEDTERKCKFDEFAALTQRCDVVDAEKQALLYKFSSLQAEQKKAYHKFRSTAGKEHMSWTDVDLTTFELKLMMQNARKMQA